MEEATNELRNAVHLALSIEPNYYGGNGNGNNGGANDEEEPLNNDIPVLAHHHHHHGSSEGTYISSLSGSLPSERSRRKNNYYAANNNDTSNSGRNMGGNNVADGNNNDGIIGRHEWQRRRLDAATRVENAVSNYELAVFNHFRNDVMDVHPDETQRGGDFVASDDDGANTNGVNIVDLLVAVLTSVPRNLISQHAADDCLPGGDDVHDSDDVDPREEEEYLSSMEQVCFDAACIASDVIRKHFQSNSTANASTFFLNPPVLEDRHVYELIDEVVQICNSDPLMLRQWSNIDPIARILNPLSECRQIEHSIHEREEGSLIEVEEDGYQQTIFGCLTSKESLRLIHSLMYRYLCDQEDEGVEASELIGHFISYLLERFASAVGDEMGYHNSHPEGATLGVFDSWADVVDEQMERRLNDEEVQYMHGLFVRYHVSSIQSALQLIENAELLISTTISDSEKIPEGIDDGTLESVVIALQDTIRHLNMAVTSTEVMQKLGLEFDPEIRTIFYPLIVSYARFVASFLHDAVLLLRRTCGSTHEGEEIRVLADDLLFRMCRVELGQELLKSHTDTGEEVIAISLLRAVESQCIAGNSSFLLDIAAGCASYTGEDNAADDCQPIVKRRRFGNGQLQHPPSIYKDKNQPQSEERREEMTDILLACLALSQSNQGSEGPSPLNTKQASCITSALMLDPEDSAGNGSDQQGILDPLNPWHTLRVKPLQRLAASEAASLTNNEDAGANLSNSLIAYTNAVPHLLDTSS